MSAELDRRLSELEERCAETDLKIEGMWYAPCAAQTLDDSTTYINIPEPGNRLRVVCDGEAISITWRDLFGLLKWTAENLADWKEERC